MMEVIVAPRMGLIDRSNRELNRSVKLWQAMASVSRDKIVQAALEALRTKGLTGASARTIAGLAGVNPGLIFYYFPSIDELLVAALAESSQQSLERHRSAAEAVRTPRELVALLREIYEQDSASGQIRVVSELVAGSVARPELGRKVMTLMEPWVTLAEEAVARVLAGSVLPVAALASPRELALAGVTFYLGANLVTHLGQAPETVDGLMAAAERAAAMFELLTPPPAEA
jgi:AcrR family transcriptional regulator